MPLDFVVRGPRGFNGMAFHLDGHVRTFIQAHAHLTSCGFDGPEAAGYLRRLIDEEKVRMVSPIRSTDHVIRKDDHFATWSAHCSCGWSEPILFGADARDWSVDRHIADLRSKGEDVSSVYTVGANGKINAVQTR
jgi:hypothetical protein